MDVSHMARSHAVRLMRFHMHDWFVIVGLMIMIGILNTINPFYRFVGKTMLDDLIFPLKENTVPFWAVPILAVMVPIIIIFSYYLYQRDINDLHHAILGLLFSVLISAVVTDAVKDAVGRPRPDFFWRCFPDGISGWGLFQKFDNITGRVECHGDPKVIREGHKSFPSGHTSWSFAGLGFLSLYLATKIEIFDRKGHVAKLCIVFLPIVVAILVGISRVDDYWHHWQDVFAGALLGLTMATLCYRQFFPAPYDANGVGPYTSFQMLTDAHTTDTEAADDWDTENGPYFRLDGKPMADNTHMQEGGAVNWQAESGAELDLENEMGMEGRGVLWRGTTSLDTENVFSDEPMDRRLYMGRAMGLDREWTTDNTSNGGTMGGLTTGSVSTDRLPYGKGN